MCHIAHLAVVAILIITQIAGCAAPGPNDERHVISKKWANCSLAGGTVLGAAGILQSAAVVGGGFAAGAVVAGTSCAISKLYRGEDIVSTVSWEQEPDDNDDWFPETRSVYVPKLVIRFGFDSYVLSEYEKTKLLEIADSLKQNKKIIITGYTCSIGVPVYNVYLSEMRARAVRRYLIDYGVKPWRISYEGHGKENPIASNETAAGRRENRRVEVDTSSL